MQPDYTLQYSFCNSKAKTNFLSYCCSFGLLSAFLCPLEPGNQGGGEKVNGAAREEGVTLFSSQQTAEGAICTNGHIQLIERHLNLRV